MKVVRDTTFQESKYFKNFFFKNSVFEGDIEAFDCVFDGCLFKTPKESRTWDRNTLHFVSCTVSNSVLDFAKASSRKSNFRGVSFTEVKTLHTSEGTSFLHSTFKDSNIIFDGVSTLTDVSLGVGVVFLWSFQDVKFNKISIEDGSKIEFFESDIEEKNITFLKGLLSSTNSPEILFNESRFVDCDLSGMSFDKTTFRTKRERFRMFRRCKLIGTDFRNSYATYLRFEDCDISKSLFPEGSLVAQRVGDIDKVYFPKSRDTL